jgi:hypothetical protein
MLALARVQRRKGGEVVVEYALLMAALVSNIAHVIKMAIPMKTAVKCLLWPEYKQEREVVVEYALLMAALVLTFDLIVKIMAILAFKTYYININRLYIGCPTSPVTLLLRIVSHLSVNQYFSAWAHLKAIFFLYTFDKQ